MRIGGKEFTNRCPSYKFNMLTCRSFRQGTYINRHWFSWEICGSPVDSHSAHIWESSKKFVSPRFSNKSNNNLNKVSPNNALFFLIVSFIYDVDYYILRTATCAGLGCMFFWAGRLSTMGRCEPMWCSDFITWRIHYWQSGTAACTNTCMCLLTSFMEKTAFGWRCWGDKWLTDTRFAHDM